MKFSFFLCCHLRSFLWLFFLIFRTYSLSKMKKKEISNTQYENSNYHFHNKFDFV